MEKERLEILLEDIRSKFDLMFEGQKMLNNKLDQIAENLEQKITEVDKKLDRMAAELNRKIDGVASDLAEHRADKETIK